MEKIQLIGLAMILVVMLPSIDYLITGIEIFDEVYAVTITKFANQGTTTQQHAMAIVRLGDILYISGDSTGDRISTFTVNGNGTLTAITQITCADCSELWIAGTSQRVYTRTNNPSPTIHEIDPTGNFIARSFSVTCNPITSQYAVHPILGNHIMICSDGTNDQIDTVNVSVNPMVKTDGGSINSGAYACDTPMNVIPTSIDDVAFVTCTGVTDRIVVLDNLDFTVAQSPIFGVNRNVTPSEISYNTTTKALLVCDGANNLVGYKWNGTQLTGGSTISTGDCIASQNVQSIWSDSERNIFFVYINPTGNDYIITVDAYDFEILDTISLTEAVGTNIGIYGYSSNEFWITFGKNVDAFEFAKFDGIGLQAGFDGTGGQPFLPESSPTGGIDCTLPANTNILICRLGGTGSLDDTGTLIGDSLNDLLCNILPINCTANPNIETNGVGYILTIISFAIITAIFFVATKGNLSDIPTFVWMIISLALLGFATAIDWIDPTFLIIGIIGILGLAVAKSRNTLFGNSFGSGDFK